MAGWLEKILPQAPPAVKGNTLPVKRVEGQITPLISTPVPHATLPAASVVYGIAASGLFVVALYFLLTGRWFTGGLVLLPAVCFLGFAVQFLKAR